MCNDLIKLEEEITKNFSNHKVFVAVGGDGTVNTLIKYLINHQDKYLAILPFGSGNGFANELGFKFDIDNLIEKISRGEILNIDVLEINKNFFINLAGIGLDAEIAHQFQTSKERGFINYIFSTIKTYFSFKPFNASIIGNGVQTEGLFKMVSIANTRQFGNNALISPASISNDGKFEVVLLNPVPIYDTLLFVYKLFKGTLEDSKYIHYLCLENSISIKTSCNKFHIDGDPYTSSNGEYEVKINKGCLKIIKM